MREEREPHPAPAQTDQYGQRQYTPEPAPQDVNRNFGWTRPQEDQ